MRRDRIGARLFGLLIADVPPREGDARQDTVTRGLVANQSATTFVNSSVVMPTWLTAMI